MSFQSLRNLEKKCDKKIEHFVPLNKNYDVTTRTSAYSIFKSNVIQNQVKLGTYIKQDERNSKISNILLPWQHSGFEPSLIGNTIISFFTPQLGHSGVSLAFGMHWHSQITFDCNRLKLFTS